MQHKYRVAVLLDRKWIASSIQYHDRKGAEDGLQRLLSSKEMQRSNRPKAKVFSPTAWSLLAPHKKKDLSSYMPNERQVSTPEEVYRGPIGPIGEQLIAAGL